MDYLRLLSIISIISPIIAEMLKNHFGDAFFG